MLVCRVVTDIAVTGAAGRIGSEVRETFADRSVTAVDVSPVEGEYLHDDHTFVEADVTDDVETLADAFPEDGAVVHLAARSGADESWERVRRPNVDGTERVYEAARRAGTSRVVFASSNHVTGMHNAADPGVPESLRADARALTVDSPVAPSGYYGVSKVAGEALGRLAADRHGVEVVNLRIGWFLTPERLAELQHEPEPTARYARAMYLSPRDCRHAFRRAVDADPPENPLTVHVTSANRERTMALTHTMRALGYEPRDDSAAVIDDA